MPKTPDIRAKRTKQALQEAMFSLLKTNDFEDITINDVCMTAAVSRTTLYIHYQDKYDLAADSIFQMVAPLTKYLYTNDLRFFFHQLLITVQENDTVIRRLRKIDSTMELRWKIDRLFFEGFIGYYQSRETAGTACGVPAEALAVYHCAGTMNLILWWHANDYLIPIDEMINYLITNNLIS